MHGSLERDRSVRRFYPRLKRRHISEQDIDPELSDQRDRIAFQKARDWRARKSMVPLEVLKAAGVMDRDEIDFFLGRINNDPNPLKQIKFPRLIRSSEEIPEIELDEIHPALPKHRLIPRERGSSRQEIIDAILSRPLPPMTSEQLGTLNRQTEFSSAVLFALATASGDLETSERRAIEGKLDEGFPAVDRHPDRLPTYHRLVAAPVEHVSKIA